MKSTTRLASLDVFRGITVMLMIFVNNGAGEQIFATLQHSRWNGLTLCDLVFPFFLFMMGTSTYLSLRKSGFEWSRATACKIVRRTATLFAIGLAINWFDMACSGRPLDLGHLRIMGVMQRIALCYGATALLALAAMRVFRSFRILPYVAGLTLTLYTLLVVWGGGYTYDAASNVLAIVDTHILGYDHLYHKSPVDPEGLLSTMAAIAHTLLGFWAASWALNARGDKHQLAALRRFLTIGSTLAIAGCIAAIALPLNKRIWSPSYVLLTCGLAAIVQALFVYLVDIRHGARHDSSPAKGWGAALIFGTNPLFLYLASEIISIAFGTTGIKEAAYAAIHTAITDGYWASVTYAALFVLLHVAIGYPLWRRHIYIKI